MEGSIRVGYISSVNYETGMVRIHYPDREMTTAEFPYYCFCGEYCMPKVLDMVLVLHLSNDSTSGIVLGKFWTDTDKPGMVGPGIYHKQLSDNAYTYCKDGELVIRADQIRFECGAGSITAAELIGLKNQE